jgi:hypothetical protein
VRRMMAVKPGRFAIWRIAKRRSWNRTLMG